MSARSTRDRLIDAAFVVVAREGIEAASVKCIAAEAGITAGLLHYHFASKDALLEAALRRALDAYVAQQRVRRARTRPSDLLAAFLADARAAITTDADFFRVRLSFAARALTDPALASVSRDITDAAVAETALTFAAAAGRARATKADRLKASALKAAFDGLMLAYLTDPQFPIQEAGALIFAAIADSGKD